MRHHFQDDESGFGVSAPWWDMVFGTYLAPARGEGKPRGRDAPVEGSRAAGGLR